MKKLKDSAALKLRTKERDYFHTLLDQYRRENESLHEQLNSAEEALSRCSTESIKYFIEYPNWKSRLKERP